jgi:hypothetical protein
VPGDPLVYYAGSASGGIHESVDGGTTWDLKALNEFMRGRGVANIVVAPKQ